MRMCHKGLHDLDEQVPPLTQFDKKRGKRYQRCRPCKMTVDHARERVTPRQNPRRPKATPPMEVRSERMQDAIILWQKYPEGEPRFLDRPEAWMDASLCSQMADPDSFFPEHGTDMPPPREVIKVCNGCDVRAECLEYAIKHDEQWGIWGGLKENDRERARIDAGLPKRPRSDLGKERPAAWTAHYDH